MHIAQILFPRVSPLFLSPVHKANTFKYLRAKALRFPRTPNFHTFLPLLVYILILIDLEGGKD